MGKIGRNHPCPCGSGKKYKHCCLPGQQAGTPGGPINQMRGSLMAAIEKVQGKAAAREASFLELGVFVLYSDHQGDAWLLEVTDSDAVQIARAGEYLEVPIDENPETIAINFSHTFAIRDRQLVLTAYADQAETVLGLAPTQQIHAAIRRLYKRYPKDMLERLHLERGEGDAAA